MKRLLGTLMVLVTIVFAGCEQPRHTITVITTNDIHGGIDNFPSLATLVKQYRAQEPGRVIFVDAGDRWTGNAYVDLAPERGLPVMQMLDSLGVQLATYGNHDFDFGLDVLSKRVKEASYSFIAANIDSNGSPLPQPAPYHMMTVDGVKFCFLGLITTARGGYPDGFVENFGPIIFSHPEETALRYGTLRDSCDVFVALTHIGYEADSLLALKMPALDMILGGHSHTFIPATRTVKNTVITQAAAGLQYVSITTLNLRGRKIEGIENKVVKLDTVAPDPKYAAMVNSCKQRPEFMEVMGSVDRDLDKDGVMNMVTDMLRQTASAQLAIYNRGGIRIDSLAAGDVTLVDVFSMEPFGNSINILRLSADQIKTLIINKYNSTGKEAYHEDLYPSGFTYTIITDSEGRATDVKFDFKSKPSSTGVYTVATSDYLQSRYDFPQAGTGESTGIIVAPAIMRYFKEHSTVKGDTGKRISIK